jgi:gamma-glutamylcyclotransferase (GGCT)/AIG2-like uncharacterized protein YtfP
MTEKAQVTEQSTYVFTYGTLRPSLYPSVPNRFGVTPVGPGILEATYSMYNLGRFPALVKTGDDTTIRGEVVEIEDIKRLDWYEGYNSTNPSDGLYDRTQQKVTLDDGRVLEAWVYFMHKAPSGVDLVESGDWGSIVGGESDGNK